MIIHQHVICEMTESATAVTVVASFRARDFLSSDIKLTNKQPFACLKFSIALNSILTVMYH